MNTSFPLTLSLISTDISPSLKVETLDFPTGTPNISDISSANCECEFPANTFIVGTAFVVSHANLHEIIECHLLDQFSFSLY